MGLRINNNIAAMNAYRNLSVTDGQMSKSLEKLSSGFRINRAADDAAGLSISEGLRAQVGGLKVAVRNAQDGISVVQTAEGALSEVHSILQRMRDLSVQSSNTGSQDANARAAAQTEFDQLKTEIDRVGNTTKFGSTKLLDGTLGATASSTGTLQTAGLTTAGLAATHSFTVGFNDNNGNARSVTIALADATAYTGQAIVDAVNSGVSTAQAGWGAGNTTDFHAEFVQGLGSSYQVKLSSSLTFTTSAVGAQLSGSILEAAAAHAPTGTGGVFQVGANNSSNSADKITVAIGDVRTSALASGILAGVSAKIASGDSTAIDNVDAAITAVSTARANLGAYQNRFEHTISNLSVTSENLSASESRIRDTDMAQEMVAFTRSQILTQAGTAMLAQANQAPQQVLQLLRG
jgi:flagellin